MPLDRKAVIATALALLDEVGLEALTLRRLAEKLKVQAPAIYWHFRNKQDLLDEMATAVLRTESLHLRIRRGLRWDAWARSHGKLLRQMLLRYRDGARMVSGTRLTDPSLYASMEKSLKKLVDAGFSAYDATLLLSTIYSYAVGFVIEEQAVFPQKGKKDDAYDLKSRSRRINAEKAPLALEAGDYLFRNFNRRYEDGLNLIIAGAVAGRSERK